MKKNFTKKEAIEMVNLYKTGSTLGFIAKKYDTYANIVMDTIKPYIKDNGSDDSKGNNKTENKRTQFSEEDIEQMLRLKNNGNPYEKIAELCGSTPETVKKVIKENINKFGDLYAPKKNKDSEATPNESSKNKSGKKIRLTKKEIDKILDYHKTGFDIKDIAQDLKRAESTIRSVLIRYKQIEPNKSSESNPQPAKQHMEQPPVPQTASTPDDEPRFTEYQIKSMLQLYKQNKSLPEISEATGIPLQSVAKIAAHIPTRTETRIEKAPAPKEKTLDDFEPNEMFIHLFDKKGYFIENNQICIMQKQVVKLKQIIEESKIQN